MRDVLNKEYRKEIRKVKQQDVAYDTILRLFTNISQIISVFATLRVLKICYYRKLRMIFYELQKGMVQVEDRKNQR